MKIIEYFKEQFENIWGILTWVLVAITVCSALGMLYIAIFKL